MSDYTGNYTLSTLQDYDGYLGFAPVNSAFDSEPFVKALQTAGTITDAIATFELKRDGYGSTLFNPNKKSRCYVGEKVMNENNTIGQTVTAANPASATQWILELNSLQLGETSVSDASSNAVISSGLPHIYLPETIYDSFTKEIKKALPQFNCTGEYCYQEWTDCNSISSSMPDLTLNLKGSNTAIHLSGAGYSYHSGDNELADGTKCSLAVRKWTGTDTLLGTAFMMNFVVAFDYTALTYDMAVALEAAEGACINSDTA